MLVLAVNYSPQVRSLSALPDVLHMTQGQQHLLNLGLPLTVRIEQEDGVAALSSTAQTLSQATQNQVQLSPSTAGSMRVHLSLLGFLPIKDVEVQVSQRRTLIPGGQAIGVALHTSGVLVVGTSDLSGGQDVNPARQAGVKPGDLLCTVNGTAIKSATHLTELVNQMGGKQLSLGIERQNRKFSVQVLPAIDQLDGHYRLGVWVRDSTAGVGTLSFYDPGSRAFGALGHAITDVDTGLNLTVGEGQILHANVVDVLRGKRGEPGELKGSFLKERQVLGDISGNNQFGIYGHVSATPSQPLYPNGLPVGARSMVHPGKATILSTVGADGMQEYEIEIVRVTPQSRAAQKSMVLRVTDPRLLEKTGGIVQGMSGSPILQDGYIIGAVTHVYVNDPTQGYGMYIDWMLEQADAPKQAAS